MFAMKTIRAGQRAAVWDKRGDVAFVAGPKRLMLSLSHSIQLLTRHAAGPHEYLVVRFKDGHVQHLHGPAAVWFHPVEHEEVRVLPAIHLDANEAVVVYRQEPEKVSRRVVRGPDVFMPAANEWLHEFSWHGSDPSTPRKKVPHALRFTKLRVIPDQTYVDVEDVRTADDALLVVQLMVFFELACIDTMLDQTHDPTADFVNAVSADVIDFVAGLTFESFKEHTEQLNDLATYRALTSRAERIGYRINKVVYRGYQANPRLQAMHDHAIEARTKLRLESETERQSQELADLRLAREADRANQRQQMEAADLAHKNRLSALAHEQSARELQAEREQELSHRQREREQEREHERLSNELKAAQQQALNRERAAFLQSVRSLEVDMTRYLTARYQHPDRLIRIDGNGDRQAQLHLHEG
jgi:hypothetical protein